MLIKKENDSLRVELNISTKVIGALNRQVGLLSDQKRERVGPRKEPDFQSGIV